MTELNPRVVEGSNNPPPDPLKIRADELVVAANKWAATPIADQDNADMLSAFIDQVRAAYKAVEERRTTEKKPYLDKAAAVDGEWNPLKALLDAAKKAVEPRMTAWLQKLENDRQEALRLEKERADALITVAAEAAATAEKEAKAGGDLIGATVAAEAAAKAASDAEKTVTKLEATPTNFKSSLGAKTKSLRTYWHARVTSHMQALAHFKNHPEVIAVIERLAEQGAGEKAEPIPGVEFYSEKKAA